MLQGALFAGSNRVLGFLGGSKICEISVSKAFEKSISTTAFLFFDFLGFGDPISSAGTSGSVKDMSENRIAVNVHEEIGLSNFDL